jgi:hypothetical protein
MTKDGELRDAKDVTTQQVKQLQSEGMIPVWYVETSYLEQEYGRKGEPKPAKSRENADAKVTLRNVPNTAGSDPAGRREARGETQGTPLLLSDAEFLQERIRTLEQLNQQEKQRHDRIVEKLFEQLDVKDKQISAWDEVTQGLTKALATGQLAPRLLLPADARPNGFRADADVSKNDHVKEAELVEQRDDAERRSEPISSTEKKNGLHFERDPLTTAATTNNSRTSSPEAEDASAPRADEADASVTETAAVGEGSAPSGTTKPPKKKSRKNARKKSSRKKDASKKRTRATTANSESKVPAAKATAKSPPKLPRKSRGFFSRFFHL